MENNVKYKINVLIILQSTLNIFILVTSKLCFYFEVGWKKFNYKTKKHKNQYKN